MKRIYRIPFYHFIFFNLIMVSGCIGSSKQLKTSTLPTSASTASSTNVNTLYTQNESAESAITPTKYLIMLPSETPTETLSPCPNTPIPELNTIIESSSAYRVKQLSCLSVGRVHQIAYAPDGSFLAAAHDQGISFYQAKSLSLIDFIPSKSIVITLSISPNGKILATGSVDKAIRLWRISDGACFRTIKEKSAFSNVVFSPNGKLLAVGSSDWTIKIYRVADGQLLFTLAKHEAAVTSVAFSPDGKTLLSGSLDGYPILWRISDGIPLRLYTSYSYPKIHSIAFSADGNSFAEGVGKGEIRVWQVSDGTLLREFEGHTSVITTIAFSPDGTLLTTGSKDSTIRFWFVPSGIGPILMDHASDVTSIVYSPDGTLMASGSLDGTIRFWGVAGNE